MVHEASLPKGDRDDAPEPQEQLNLPIENRKGTWLADTDDDPIDPPYKETLLETQPMISQKAIWLNADQHGWHNPPADLTTDLLLIHSEISEACEALRQGNLRMFMPAGDSIATTKDSVEEELADAIIRILHVAEKNGFDMCRAVAAKHQKNINRPFRHGNKRF